MLTREHNFKHVKENYGTSFDYPFQKPPSYAVLRHESNEKWYNECLPEKLGLD